ncbi:MAG: hypothetical protein ACRC2R_17420 [Xenococcaceae cyanobacterium]
MKIGIAAAIATPACQRDRSACNSHSQLPNKFPIALFVSVAIEIDSFLMPMGIVTNSKMRIT